MWSAIAVAIEIAVCVLASIWIICNYSPLSHEEYISSYALRPPPRLIGRMFHGSALIFFVTVAIADLNESNGSCLLYYTYWNFILQTIYWIWALVDPKRMSRGRCMLLDVILPTSVVVTIVVWTILYPLYGDVLMNWISWSQHGGNLFLFLIEFICSDVRSVPWSTGAFVVVWATIYAIFAWGLNLVGNFWTYPFLNVYEPMAPLWYFALLLLHVACFGLVMILAMCKVFIAELIPIDDGSSTHLLPHIHTVK